MSRYFYIYSMWQYIKCLSSSFAFPQHALPSLDQALGHYSFKYKLAARVYGGEFTRI